MSTSFGTQSSHEVRSLKLKPLLEASSKLAHLSSIPVALANYRVSSGWFSSSVSMRFPDLEACSAFETLGTHLKLSVSQVEDRDTLAVSASDARAIQHAMSI
jgi:hypothetical protein